MKQAPARAHHHAEPGVSALSTNEEEGQQLIGWRLFVCFAIGSGLWFGIIQSVAAGLPGSEMWGRILSVVRLVVLAVGAISLALASMAGLNEVLRRIGSPSGRVSSQGPATSSPSSAGGRLS